MNLEVGMYVRTLNGIVKIDKIQNDVMKDTKGCLHYGDFIKESHNIIKLIEEKDLLEIEYFSLRYEERVTRIFEVTYKDGRFINLANAKCQFMLIDNDWTDNDKELEPIIKSIVTKEQFENMKYSLEG